MCVMFCSHKMEPQQIEPSLVNGPFLRAINLVMYRPSHLKYHTHAFTKYHC